MDQIRKLVVVPMEMEHGMYQKKKKAVKKNKTKDVEVKVIQVKAPKWKVIK